MSAINGYLATNGNIHPIQSFTIIPKKTMKFSRHLKPILFFPVLLMLCLQTSVAEQVITLDEVHPKQTGFAAFNSFKHGLLLVAFTQKNIEPFDCLPNRYVFYDFKNEDYFEILAGNLLINGNYTKIFRTTIHTIGKLHEKNSGEWRKRIQSVMEKLNVSSETMESGKTSSSDGITSCWQQPEVVDLETRNETSFPFLAANLCKYSWCSEFYWVDNETIQLWVQLKPDEFHRIRMNTINGSHEFNDKTGRFYKKTFVQSNAPRANLVDEKNLEEGSFTISSRKGHGIRLVWKKRTNGKINVSLVREGKDSEACRKIASRINKQLRRKQYAEALQTVKFGFWLDPDDRNLKVTRLKVHASLLLVDSFFKHLTEDFTDRERFSVCQELHMDPALKNLWKQKHFAQTFKEKCP